MSAGATPSAPGSASDPDREERLARGRELVSLGLQALAEGHAVLAGLLAGVSDPRERGAINQMIWDAARAGGARAPYFSRSGQDAFLDEEVFRGRRGGVFVEVGGFDGLTASNSLFFEVVRGWSGILVEPAQGPRAKAAEFRRCPCLPVAVAASTGEAAFLEVEEGEPELSGLELSYDPAVLARLKADPAHRMRRRPVRTRTLAQVLDSHYLRAVDYISLDVAGAELAVLEAFPFELYTVQAFSIDCRRNDAAIGTLMQARGYDRRESLGSDDIWVRRAR